VKHTETRFRQTGDRLQHGPGRIPLFNQCHTARVEPSGPQLHCYEHMELPKQRQSRYVWECIFVSL